MTISIATNHQQQQQQQNSPKIHIPYARIKNDKALCWIYENIQQHKLYQKLKYLISDDEHLSSCYEVTAFLQNEQYQTALFLCLKACETNQQNLLTQIDVALYTNRIVTQSHHKRSTSHPDFSFLPQPLGKCQIDGSNSSVMGAKLSVPFSYDTDTPLPSYRSTSRCDNIVTDLMQLSAEKKSARKPKQHRHQRHAKPKTISVTNLKLRPWHSLPDVSISTDTHRTRSQTLSQPIHIPFRKIRLTAETLAINNGEQKVPSFSYKQLPSDSASSTGLPVIGVDDLKTISLVKCDDIKIHFDAKYRADNNAANISNLNKSMLKIPTPPTLSSSSQSTGIFSFINRESFSLFNNTEKQLDSMTSSFLATSSASSDFVRTFLPPRQGEKIQNRYQQRALIDFCPSSSSVDKQQLSSSESAANSYYPNSQNFHQPLQQHTAAAATPLHGQSLTSFLQAGQFSRVNNELERENAHFSVSEAMISAIEQIKWTNSEKLRIKQKQQADAQRLGVKKKKKREHCMRNWDNSAAASYSFGGAAVASTSTSSPTSLSGSDNSIESHFSADSDTSDDGENGAPKYLKVSFLLCVCVLFSSYFMIFCFV